MKGTFHSVGIFLFILLQFQKSPGGQGVTDTILVAELKNSSVHENHSQAASGTQTENSRQALGSQSQVLESSQKNDLLLTQELVFQRVRDSNYEVLENQIQADQSQQSILVARRNLLPKLNLFRAFALSEGLVGWIGLSEDFLPFLVPANWFRKEEQKIIDEKVKLGLDLVKINQLQRFRELYWQIHSDEKLLEDLRILISIFDDLVSTARGREAFGEIAPGRSKEVYLKSLSLKADEQNLARMLRGLKAELAVGLGLSMSQKVQDFQNYQLDSSDALVDVLDSEDLKKEKSFSSLAGHWNFFVTRAVLEAKELQQLDKLFLASDSFLKSTQWTILGVSPLARSFGAELFDNIPVQDGLGFGQSSSRQMIRLTQEIIKLQKGIAEKTLQSRLQLVSTSLAEGYLQLRERIKGLSEARARLNLYRFNPEGSPLDPLLLVDSAQTYLQALNGVRNQRLLVKISEERWNRSLVLGPYARILERKAR